MNSAADQTPQGTDALIAFLHDAVHSAARQLDEVRLPLHILLDGRFGALSENQEELLAAASDAAQSLYSALQHAGEVVDACRAASGLPLVTTR